jgi:hypothetical protein
LKRYNQKRDEENKKIIRQEIEKQNNRKEKYINLSKHLTDTEQTQVSTSDPDSRQMRKPHSIKVKKLRLPSTFSRPLLLFFFFAADSSFIF